MDFWIPLIGSALGGAVITSIFGFIKNRQDKAAEHSQWLRDTKQAAYAEFLSAIVQASSTLEPTAAAKESQRRSIIALSQIRLIAADEVTAAAVSLSTRVNEMHRLSQRRQPMYAEFSAHEAEIKEIGTKIAGAVQRIPGLTEDYVRSVRLDVGAEVGKSRGPSRGRRGDGQKHYQ